MNINTVVKTYLPSSFIKALRTIREHTSVKLLRSYQSLKLKGFTSAREMEVVFGGLKVLMFIKPNNGGVDNYIYLNSIHEPEILNVIRENVQAGDVVVDVGANIGQHSLFMSQFVGETGSVYSFEPLQSNTDSIKKSLKLNNSQNVTVETMAVGEEDTEVKMFVPETSNDRSSRELIGMTTENFEKVKMTKLDTYFADTKINFVKIDTEGFESEVISGASDIIAKHKPKILLEYAPKFYEARKVDSNDLLSTLIKHDYVLQDVSSGVMVENVPAYTAFLTKGGSGISNILAIPR